MGKLLLLILNGFFFLSGVKSCVAQLVPHYPDPYAVLPNRGESFQYVLLRGTTFKVANLVETERPLPAGPQQLSILNLHVPLAQAAPGSFSLHPSLAAVSTMLITLAIMPDEIDNQVHWQRIEPDTLAAARRVAPTAFIDSCFQRLARYHNIGSLVKQDNRFTRNAGAKPIIYRDGHYWTTSNYTLTELFLICPVPFVLPYNADNVTISTLARPYPDAQLTQEWLLEQKFRQGRGARLSEFLASKILLSERINATTYEFITFPPNIVDDSYFYSGAGNFRYQQGVGLISGRYSLHVIPNITSTGVPFTTKRITALK